MKLHLEAFLDDRGFDSIRVEGGGFMVRHRDFPGRAGIAETDELATTQLRQEITQFLEDKLHTILLAVKHAEAASPH